MLTSYFGRVSVEVKDPRCCCDVCCYLRPHGPILLVHIDAVGGKEQLVLQLVPFRYGRTYDNKPRKPELNVLLEFLSYGEWSISVRTLKFCQYMCTIQSNYIRVCKI